MSINCEIRQIVELLNMKPSFSTQHELRFGTKGSLAINTKDNTWFDFEAQTGGGMLDFLVHCGKAKSQQDAAKWLEEHGLIAPNQTAPKRKTVQRAHIYRDQDGSPLRQAVKYTDGSWKQFGWFDGNWRPTTKGYTPHPLPVR